MPSVELSATTQPESALFKALRFPPSYMLLLPYGLLSSQPAADRLAEPHVDRRTMGARHSDLDIPDQLVLAAH
jgi:hypothetical protein